MELKLGIMTLAELAEWFGITASTMRKAQVKEKKLEILKAFADYHIEGRSVFIDKICIPEYNKAYDVIKEQLPQEWNKNGLDTCSRVGSAIYWKNKIVKASIKEITAQSYARGAKVQLYGKNNSGEPGELGFSNYEWCRRIGYDCQPLTEEQHDIVRECSKETFGALYSEQEALLTSALADKAITEQEFYERLGKVPLEKRLECYEKFQELVIDRLGFMPDRATRITNGSGAF